MNILNYDGHLVWTETRYFTCCLLLTKSNRKLEERVHLFLSSVIVVYVRVKTFHMYHNNALRRNCCLVHSLKLDVRENRIGYFWKHFLCLSIFLVTAWKTNTWIHILLNNTHFLWNSSKISSLSNYDVSRLVLSYIS